MKVFEERVEISFDDLKQACKNIGFDLSCGACAEVFFTGSSSHSHADSCATHSEARGFAETIDNVREALGQDVTHYYIIADDVKELVEAVERQEGSALEVLQKIRERGAVAGPARAETSSSRRRDDTTR